MRTFTVIRIQAYRATSPNYWIWRYKRYRMRPKVGYKCRLHGVDPVLTVRDIRYKGEDVLLSNGQWQSWYHCCDKVDE